MRLIASALMLVAGLAMAAEPVARFDQAQFEKRFRQADKGKKGKLSRAEAYAEFPGMPQYFDEIDRNRDGFITLDEVKRAMERRVDAAITAGRAGRYGSSATLGAGDATLGTGSATPGTGSTTPARAAPCPAQAASHPAPAPPQPPMRHQRNSRRNSPARPKPGATIVTNTTNRWPAATKKARQRGEPISDSPPTFLKKSF
jgi:hypothetical protein